MNTRRNKGYETAIKIVIGLAGALILACLCTLLFNYVRMKSKIGGENYGVTTISTALIISYVII
jgi:glucose-6-phosphate-specific signal transduction histidine kinase